MTAVAGRRSVGRWVAAGLALAAWAGLIALARHRGLPNAQLWKVRMVPIMGTRVPRFWPVGPFVLAGGLALAVVLPGWCARTTWRRLLVGLALVAAGWGLALSMVRSDQIDRGMVNEHEYVTVVPFVDQVGVRQFVDTFTDPDVLARYPIHIEGHPVGAALAFVGLDRIGLGGPRNAFWVLLAIGATTASSVLTAARAVAGERAARRAAPFLVLGPGAIWTVSSGDALFAAVGAAACAAVVVAACRSGDPVDGPVDGSEAIGSVAGAPSGWSPGRVAVLAAAGGALFGVGLLLSYGLVPLALVPTAVAVWRRRWAVLLWAGVGGLAVLAAAAVAGFWWFDGLAATRVRYTAGIASTRPHAFFTFLGNPAAFALSLGPAAVVGLVWLRDRRLAVLVGAAAAAVLAADLSGLSKAEVERIWLPFAPWVLLATASIADGGGRRAAAPAAAGPVDPAGRDPAPTSIRPAAAERSPILGLASVALAAQVGVAVAIESVVRTPW